MNLGSDFDLSDNSYTITGKLPDITITKLLSAIVNSVEAVNEPNASIQRVKILHKEAGVSLDATKSDGTIKQQKEKLVNELKGQLNANGVDGKVPEYNKKLHGILTNKIRMSEDMQIKPNGLSRVKGVSVKSPKELGLNR
jgi:hypothetical protein